MGFLCVLKMYHVRLYIVEKIGFGMASRRCEIHSKPKSLLQKTCMFYIFETLAAYVGECLRTHALAHVSRPLLTYASRGPLWSFISKNKFLLI